MKKIIEVEGRQKTKDRLLFNLLFFGIWTLLILAALVDAKTRGGL